MHQQIYIKLPVKDLERSQALFGVPACQPAATAIAPA